jgi:tRNA pseudouridine65 synthase
MRECGRSVRHEERLEPDGPREAQAVEVLWRDERLVAVAKPPGISVHRGQDRDRDVLLARVRDAVGRWVYPVHRLDRGASGVVLFALDPATAAVLQRQFRAGTVAKRYIAVVRGVPAADGVIDHPVPRSRDGARVVAVSSWRVLGSFGRYGVVEVWPHTGRYHQIRRHMKHLGHPLIGDVRYGKGEHNRWFRERFGLHRLALHAVQLGFDDPLDARRRVVEAPLPDDLARVLDAAGVLTRASASLR